MLLKCKDQLLGVVPEVFCDWLHLLFLPSTCASNICNGTTLFTCLIHPGLWALLLMISWLVIPLTLVMFCTSWALGAHYTNEIDIGLQHENK